MAVADHTSFEADSICGLDWFSPFALRCHHGRRVPGYLNPRKELT